MNTDPKNPYLKHEVSMLFRQYKSLPYEMDHPHFYANTLYDLTNRRFTDENAEKYWGRIVKHYNFLEGKLNRKVNLAVAAMDYLETVSEEDEGAPDKGDDKSRDYFDLLDSDTGIFSQKYFDLAITSELKKAKQHNTEFSVAFFAPNNMSPIRSQQISVTILKELASAIDTMSARDMDLFCKYNETTFAFILPGLTATDAGKFFERIQLLLKQSTFFRFNAITISAGIATYPHQGFAKDDLVAAGLGALKTAMEGGSEGMVAGKSERRRARRFNQTWNAAYHLIEDADMQNIGKISCKVVNISLTGVCVEMKEELDKDLMMIMFLYPPLFDKKDVISMLGRICWVGKITPFRYQYGVEFINLQDIQKKKLENALPLHKTML